MDESPTDRQAAPVDPEEVFARFLAQRARDEGADFEAFCAEHPAHAAALRRLHAEWLRVEGLLDRLGASRSLSERIESVLGGVDPGVSLDVEESSPTTSARTTQRLERLALYSAPERRYAARGEIGRGGMGAVLRVWDEDLRRPVAMKMVLGGKEFLAEDEQARVDPHKLARFLEEAQITSQLEHPGIVPVHELGLDAHGRVYFTMRLVRGVSLRQVVEYVHRPELAAEDGVREEWTLPRALAVVLRVCEAMSYAHSKGVVHRDLKPANVMVGRFGETYVMDWGLARVKGRPDLKNIRVREDESHESQSDVRTDRADEEVTAGADAPVVTMDGDVVGTPVYMPPEQARGRIDEVDAQSDVYSVGAILYHLLTGHRPYLPGGARLAPYLVLEAVRSGPPEPIEALAPDVPPELAAICRKAMARRRDERYASMPELADDLRRYLELRVVRAYETGAVAELRKWVARNRALAASLAGGLLVLVLGLAGVGWVEARGHRAAEVERGKAVAAEARTRAVLDELEDYTEAQEAGALLAHGVDGLWPPWPERAAECEGWLRRAEALVARRGAVADRLAELRATALPPTDAERARDEDARRALRDELELARAELRQLDGLLAGHPDPPPVPVARRAELRPRVAWLEEAVAARTSWRFADPEDTLRHDLLASLDASLAELPAALRTVERLHRLATTVEERTVTGDAAAAAWRRAAADVAADPRFGGLELEPRLGLSPLRRDPQSGLWEFLWVFSGEAPAVGDDDRWVLDESTGIVFVLLPGGTFRMGCDPPGAYVADGDPNTDPDCSTIRSENPSRAVVLDAFYASKYEVTQAQWLRATGSNPATLRPENMDPAYPVAYTRLHPVETVDWHESRAFCDRLGLTLPTEARWQYACRAGTRSVWSTGDDVASLRGYANVADLTMWSLHPDWDHDDFSDGFANSAPVGSLLPNAFGLHDVHGNVLEWCLEYSYSGAPDHRAGDGLRLPNLEAAYVLVCGGSWFHVAADARSAFHGGFVPTTRLDSLGLRPVLDLRPAP